MGIGYGGHWRQVISPMTFALMEDSGWYALTSNKSGENGTNGGVEDAAAVGAFTFGRGMGCAQVAQCRAETSPYYCDAEGPTGPSGSQEACTFDGYAPGPCDLPIDGCSTVTPFLNYPTCRGVSPGTDIDASETTLGFDPAEWGHHFGRFGRCLPIATEPATWNISWYNEGYRAQDSEYEYGNEWR